jgi:hypothetical protein
MHGTIIHAGRSSNLGGAVSGIGNAETGTIQSILTSTLKAIVPRKTWGFLVDFLGLSERVAKHRISGTRAFTADELAALLRSEHGLDFLSAIMADAEPKWWVTVHSAFKLGAMRRHKLQLQDAINEAERLGDTLARAETALGFCGPDGDRKASDALRPTARGQDRALVGGRR